MRARLRDKVSTSLIRVGDAESNALTYDAEFARYAESDAAEREVVWWGRALDPASARAKLAGRVLDAMRDADILGIPTLERILRDVKPERREFLGNTRAGRGIRTVLRALEDGGALANPRALMISAHVQHDLGEWNLYRELFDGAARIVAVSCHASLPDAFHKRFGVAIAQNIVVPPRHASLASFGMTEMGPKILPEVMDETIAQLGADLRGRMVIVGAGYAGKVIVQEAKKRGAVALDLGSVLDYWIGASTRSYLTTGAVQPSPGGRVDNFPGRATKSRGGKGVAVHPSLRRCASTLPQGEGGKSPHPLRMEEGEEGLGLQRFCRARREFLADPERRGVVDFAARCVEQGYGLAVVGEIGERL